MIVQCPKCKTSYKVADELFKDSSPAFRCSRCKHTFQLESSEPPQKPAVNPPTGETQPVESSASRELSFIFPPREEQQNIPAGVPPVDAPPGESETVAVENNHPDQWAISADLQKSEAPFTISEASHSAQKEEKLLTPPNPPPRVTPAPEWSHTGKPVAPSSTPVRRNPEQEPPAKAGARVEGSTPTSADGEENILRLGPYRDQQTSTTPYLTLFALLIIIFALATAFNRAHPSATEGFVRQIPLVGASVLRNNRLNDGVLLQSLRGGYQSIQGNREVFVITGVALNQNPVTIRAVQISGESFNNQNEEIEKQTIWVGNAISPSIVRGLSLQEIANLQRLPPLKTFEIPPGDSVPFTIVFLKTPKGMKDFGCKVISAEGDA
ncbi:MAG: zinc-ribbon domain-containing protein [Deltaproteobacteria bacterium]|nr:zinc-ribbon domain-containing protein [Deltaproteobacteria bacterium]